MPSKTRPRIAIPMPHSLDREYAERAIPQYERAVEQAGGEPVRIPLDQTPAEWMKEVTKLIERCDAVLLPGSNADVDPAKFGATRSPRTAAADPRRDAVDGLLLQDAYNLRKLYRAGSLTQHIPDFLPEELRSRVDHEAGRKVAVAHAIEIERDSKLAEILCGDSRPRLSNRAQLGAQEGHGFSSADKGSEQIRALASEGRKLVVPLNSSHHQSPARMSKRWKAPRPISSCLPCNGIRSDPWRQTNLHAPSSAP